MGISQEYVERMCKLRKGYDQLETTEPHAEVMKAKIILQIKLFSLCL